MTRPRHSGIVADLSSDLVQNRGELHLSSIPVNAAYGAARETVVLVTAGVGGVTVTLPSAALNYGKAYWYKKVDAAVGLVTITRAGGDTIDGAATTVLTNQYDSMGLVSDGIATWYIIGAGAGGGGITGRKEYRTLVVAADDSTPHGKLYADYVCNGVNDEVEINTALSVVTASTYRGVTLLEGTFHIAATIDQMQSNTILEGQGDATILRVVNGHSVALKVLDISSIDDIAVERLRIDGNRANQAAGSMRMIWLDTVNNCLITNVSIVNAKTTGIYANTALTNSRIADSYFYNNATTGSIFLYQSPNNVIVDNIIEAEAGTASIWLYEASKYCVVNGNLVEDGGISVQYDCDYCTVDGNSLENSPIYATDSSYCSFSSNVIDGAVDGINIEGGIGCAIVGNAISGCTQDGIYVDMGTALPVGFAVTGNTVYNCGQHGISFSGVQSSITGNTCVDNGAANLEVSNNDRIILADNVCVGGDWAIYFYNSFRSVIKGNLCYKSNLSGLYMDTVTNVLVADNYFEGNSVTDGTLPHIRLVTGVDDCKFSDNVFREGTEANAPDYCIDIQNVNCDDNMILDNDFRGGAAVGTINDGGTGTQIVDIFTDAGVVRTWVKSGDVAHVWTIAAVDEWYAGVDDSDADKWKVGTGAAVGTNVAITADSALDVGVGTEAPAGQLHVDQSNAAGAQPVLYLDQGDDDEEFIRLDGTSAADQTKSISTVNGDGTVEGPKNYVASAGWAFEGMARMNINGTDRWMPYYSADTS